MAVILFIDMLGSRKRWQTGGVSESMKTFCRFKKLINTAARQTPEGGILDGIVETDSAMLVCRLISVNYISRVTTIRIPGSFQVNPSSFHLLFRRLDLDGLLRSIQFFRA